MQRTRPSRRQLIASLVISVATAACSTSPPTRRFMLAPRPAAAPLSFPRRVAIAGLGIAKYLDQPQIVRHRAGYEVEFAELERWAEGLADMVARTLAEDLAARLTGSQVFVGDGAATPPADASLELYVERFDPDPESAVHLSARWTIRRGSGAVRLGSERIIERAASASTNDLVAAMSDALANLADRLAAMLAA